MLSIANIRQRLIDALRSEGRGEALDAFEDWLSSAAFSEIRQDSDPELRSYVARIMHTFDLLADEAIDLLQFHLELKQLLYTGNIREARVRFIFDDDARHESIKQAELSASVSSPVSTVAV
jgi:hypothetical protein